MYCYNLITLLVTYSKVTDVLSKGFASRHSDMDAELNTRLNNVGKKLERALEPCGEFDKSRSAAARCRCKTLNKWKYKPRSTRCNRFLDGIDQTRFFPYENLLLSVKREYPWYNLHSYEDLMGRCKRIQQGTRERLLDWDNIWINPITLSSKGWDFSCLQNDSLMCQCVTCFKMLCLQLNLGSVQLNRRYWEKGACLGHSIDCPWRRNQFDLINGYYLQPWNLIRELEIAKANNQNELSLQGYEVVEKGVIQCTGCYRKAFTKSILQDRINCHAAWCKYYDSKRLDNLLGKTVRFPVDEDIFNKLGFLGSYFERL